MCQVLVRATGQRDAGSQAALALLDRGRASLRATVSRCRHGPVFAGFDGAKVERAIIAAGQPLWGHQRPATLVWLAVDDGQQRRIIDAQSNSELKQAIELTGAGARPAAALATCGRPSCFEDVWSGPAESLAIDGGRIRCRRVLAGRARSSSPASAHRCIGRCYTAPKVTIGSERRQRACTAQRTSSPVYSLPVTKL